MRPIDADALLQRIEEWDRSLRSFTHDTDRLVCDVLGGVVDEIMDLGTLDYAPVKHGEFERQPEEYIVGLHVTPIYCKTCDTTYFTMNKDGRRTICCPYCGARMGWKEDAKE